MDEPCVDHIQAKQLNFLMSVEYRKNIQGLINLWVRSQTNTYARGFYQ